MAMAFTASAQSSKLDELIEEGIALYDIGNYAGAVSSYKEALKLDKKNPTVNYELAMTYGAIGDYGNAVKYSNEVLKLKNANPGLKAQAYGIKGNALDMQGKPQQAISAYEEAIKLAPNNYMVYYNLGLTQYKLKNYAAAEQALIHAVQLNPNHASSHLLLGYTKQNQGKRTQSLLALYNFLLLEPTSERAATAYQEVRQMQQQGVTKGEGGKTMTINVGIPKGDDEFSAAEMMISLSQATALSDENKGKTEEEGFYNSTRSLFSILGELKEDKSSFWWDYYVDFFYSMKNAGNVEAMSYYVSQSSGKEAVANWLQEHQEQVAQLSSWYENYKR